MTAGQLRELFLAFFKDRGHQILPSSSLVPSEKVELTGTQRVLFTTAGMHPLIPYLLGQPHPQGRRLASIQKCLRTDDIEQVGDSVHNTFFEMAGNWSLGDYWKEEAIAFSYDFLTNHLGLDPKRLYVSVFKGDADAPFDEESYQIWLKLGIPESRIFKYGKSDNWWGPVGLTGPCGPDTEIFYDVEGGPLSGSEPATDNTRLVEVWNNVFMEYERRLKDQKKADKEAGGQFAPADFDFVPLKQRNVDTGMGLERILMVLQGTASVYETDVFLPLMESLRGLSQTFNQKSARIVADHIRAAVFLIADGVSPSNIERGYVLRRLIRRAIRHASLLKIEDSCLVIDIYRSVYPEVLQNSQRIFEELTQEETKFKLALLRGMREFQKIKGDVSAKAAFDLYQNFGFPIELTLELANESGRKVDVENFYRLLKEHQQLSRQASGRAIGGLAEQSQQAVFGHTATHLLHQALRDVLGNQVHQVGSHITAERIRFDFAFHRQLTVEEIKQVEDIVNRKIGENLKVEKMLISREEADRLGAIGLFEEKYGDIVSVYKIGDYSLEYCGGPHANSTGQLRSFKIVKEEGIGSGRRRIYAKVGV